MCPIAVSCIAVSLLSLCALGLACGHACLRCCCRQLCRSAAAAGHCIPAGHHRVIVKLCCCGLRVIRCCG